MPNDFPVNGNKPNQTATKAPQHEHWSIIRRLQEERDRLRDELDDMRIELAKTAMALAEVTQERNIYHRAVLHYTRQEVTISKEEIEEALKNVNSFQETVRMIESELFLEE